MFKKAIEVKNGDGSGTSIILRDVDIDEIAETITNDVKALNLDTSYKVNYCKVRIAQILRFYQRESVDEMSSTISDTDIEDAANKTMAGIKTSVVNLFEKAKLDAHVIQLYDKALAEETKHEICRNVVNENFSRLKEITKEELQRIDDHTKILTSVAKSTAQDYLINPHVEVGSEVTIGQQPGFEKTDAQTKKLIAQAKHNIRENVNIFLTNPTGKKTEEEIECEKLLMENFAQFGKKLKGDLLNQKEVVDKTIDNINSKMLNLLPSKRNNDES